MARLRSSIRSIHGLVHFEAAGRLMSFSMAADDLGLTQSAISHSVKQLELALGTPLFHRRRRALELTSAGERLYEAVSNSFATIAEVIDAITGKNSSQELVVACSTSMAHFWLVARILDFRRAHPQISIRLQIVDRDVNLLEERLDLYLRIGDGDWPHCDAAPLWAEEVFAVASPAYLASAAKVEGPADLVHHKLIECQDPFRRRMSWREWLRRQGVESRQLREELILTDHAVAIQCALGGEGITLGWRPIVDDLLASGRLVAAVPKPVRTGRRFYAVTRQTGGFARDLDTLKRWLEDTCKAEIEGRQI